MIVRLTGEEFRELLKEWRLTPIEAADLLGESRQLVHNMRQPGYTFSPYMCGRIEQLIYDLARKDQKRIDSLDGGARG